jgi:ribonucleotide reductase alpha subunit
MDTIKYKDYDFNLIHNCDFSNVYYNRQLKLALCIAERDYIPIDNFKAIFISISKLLDDFPIQHLIFDKRKLRTFHQPSMEWYFAIWKPTVKTKGLTDHYKILPELAWFVKSVEAGKHEILKKYSTEILNGIRINYVSSIENGIDMITELL